MKPLATNKTIPKFRIVLSIPDMDALLVALAKDTNNIIDNAELIGWLTKQKRKAEFGIMESSHVSGPSTLTKKSEAIVEQVREDSAKLNCDTYMLNCALDSSSPQYIEQTEEQVISAIQYKAEHSLVYGSLDKLETEILNEALTKQLLGGL